MIMAGQGQDNLMIVPGGRERNGPGWSKSLSSPDGKNIFHESHVEVKNYRQYVFVHENIIITSPPSARAPIPIEIKRSALIEPSQPYDVLLNSPKLLL